MDGASTIDGLRSDFIEKMGIVAQSEGMPRSAGRLFSLLVFDGTPIAFGDLAERLQISRASVSTSIRLLEERGLVKRMTRPGDRQDYFAVAPNAFVSMLRTSRLRIETARDEIEGIAGQLSADGSGARQRLIDYARFYAAVGDGLAAAIATLSDTDGPAPETSHAR